MENFHVPIEKRQLRGFDTKPAAKPLPIGLKTLRSIPFPHKLGILERLYGKMLAQQGVCWTEASNHVLWKLDLRDPTQRWIVFGDYEGPAQMQWLRNWLSQGGIVIDSGANIGQMLLFLAPLSGVEIYAFEPLPDAASWLQACLDNYSDWKVRLIRKGLSFQADEMAIQIDGARSTTRMDWYRGRNFPKTTITVTSLDAFLTENAVAKVKLWKLDVEGHELQALQGAERYLRSRRIEAALIEDSGTDEVYRYLDSCGYTLYRIIRGGRLVPFSKTLHIHDNILALPK